MTDAERHLETMLKDFGAERLSVPVPHCLYDDRDP